VCLVTSTIHEKADKVTKLCHGGLSRKGVNRMPWRVGTQRSTLTGRVGELEKKMGKDPSPARNSPAPGYPFSEDSLK